MVDWAWSKIFGRVVDMESVTEMVLAGMAVEVERG